MNKKIIKSKAFDKACKKVGLELSDKSRNTSPKGIIISDDNGNIYTLTADSNIVKMDENNLKIMHKRTVASRRNPNRRNLLRTQRHINRIRKNKSTESK